MPYQGWLVLLIAYAVLVSGCTQPTNEIQGYENASGVDIQKITSYEAKNTVDLLINELNINSIVKDEKGNLINIPIKMPEGIVTAANCYTSEPEYIIIEGKGYFKVPIYQNGEKLTDILVQELRLNNGYYSILNYGDIRITNGNVDIVYGDNSLSVP